MGKTWRGAGRAKKISDWKLKQQVNEAYRDRGKQRPEPRDEDKRVREAWDRQWRGEG